MSYKNAMADLATGGGKAVLYKVGPRADGPPSSSLRGCGGEARRDLHHGRGTSAPPSPTGVRRPSHALTCRSCPANRDSPAAIPRPGPRSGIRLAQDRPRRPLQGARIAVQGLGAVGYKLCERLDAAGAKLVVAGREPRARERRAGGLRGPRSRPWTRIHSVPADVFSPNALGAVLNVDSIEELGAAVVCGGANNQLATPLDGERLFARGVTYAPDYVVNAGGIINVMAEYNGEARESSRGASCASADGSRRSSPRPAANADPPTRSPTRWRGPASAGAQVVG